MEKVLYYLDIDTYNKLGLVMDEVKDRIEYEEKEHRHRRGICYLGVVAVAGPLVLPSFMFRIILCVSKLAVC